MNVTRENLLAATTAAITNYETKREIFDAAAARYVDAINTEAETKAMSRQRELRDALSVAIKAKKPLSADQIEKIGGGSSYVSNFSVSRRERTTDAPASFTLDGVKYARPGRVNLEDLKALKSTLENVVEEMISDGQLQRLGFKNMGWVFRAAVAN